MLCLGYLEGFHSKYSESRFIYTKNVPGTNLRRNYKLSLPLASRNLYVNKRSNWLRWDNCFFLQFYWYIVELLFVHRFGITGVSPILAKSLHQNFQTKILYNSFFKIMSWMTRLRKQYVIANATKTIIVSICCILYSV